MLGRAVARRLPNVLLPVVGPRERRPGVVSFPRAPRAVSHGSPNSESIGVRPCFVARLPALRRSGWVRVDVGDEEIDDAIMFAASTVAGLRHGHAPAAGPGFAIASRIGFESIDPDRRLGAIRCGRSEPQDQAIRFQSASVSMQTSPRSSGHPAPPRTFVIALTTPASRLRQGNAVRTSTSRVSGITRGSNWTDFGCTTRRTYSAVATRSATWSRPPSPPCKAIVEQTVGGVATPWRRAFVHSPTAQFGRSRLVFHVTMS